MQQVRTVEQLGEKDVKRYADVKDVIRSNVMLFILYKMVRNILSSAMQVGQDVTMVWYTWRVWKLMGI